MNNFTPITNKILLLATLLLTACAHPINISPLTTPQRQADKVLIQKNVAYVMTDELRNQPVTTAGGGGDRVSYYPYRDLEKVIRDVLQASYQSVVVMKSSEDKTLISSNQISLIFKPTIATSSGSDSILTWPPTKFFINLNCSVIDSDGKLISEFQVNSNGNAEFSEFKADFGLAGRRAATELAKQMLLEIDKNQALH